ncbi:MAG: hypothetical protein M1453_14330 [Acidobacteria bacterium]|nr:hypothetical protein [Acidobacteriota bacterium]
MKKLFVAFGMFAILFSFASPAAAQALPNQVLALYPRDTGEITFLDVRSLRNSPNYAEMKTKVLPERFRQLAEWTQYIGVDFDTEVYQLSWAFLPAAEGEQVGMIGIAEGNFPTQEIQRLAREKKLPNSRHAGSLILNLGKNDQGREFVFAFADANTAIFGFRDIAEKILDRRAASGPSLLDNRPLMEVIRPLNGKAPVWIAMDSQFTLLAVKQMLPQISQVAGFETLAARLLSASLQLQLSDGLRGSAALRCQTANDALVVSKLLQAAVTYQASRLNESQPDLARVLSTLRLNQPEDRVELALAISSSELNTLIRNNSLALKF